MSGPSRRVRTSAFWQEYQKSCGNLVSSPTDHILHAANTAALAAARVQGAMRGSLIRLHNKECCAQVRVRGGGRMNPSAPPKGWSGGQPASLVPPTMAEHHWPGINRFKPPWVRPSCPHWNDPRLAEAASRHTIRAERSVAPTKQDVVIQQLSQGQGLSRGSREWLRELDRWNQQNERRYERSLSSTHMHAVTLTPTPRESFHRPRHVTGTYQRSEELNITTRRPPTRGPDRARQMRPP